MTLVLHVTSGGRTFHLFFSSICCPLKCKGKKTKTLLQQSKISCSSKTRTVNRFPRQKENSLLGKEEEEHWIIIFRVLTLGCKIHLFSFPLPLTPPQSEVLSFSVLALSSLPPNPAPSTLCVLVLPRATADDSHLKREKDKKARTENQATGREVLGSRYESAACRRCVWMCF